jgi:hypothetical protein
MPTMIAEWRGGTIFSAQGGRRALVPCLAKNFAADNVARGYDSASAGYGRRVRKRPIAISRIPPTISIVIAPPKIRVDSRNPLIGVRVST